MIRLLFFAAIASVACKAIFGRWPWDYLRPTPTRQQAVFQARKLLGLEASATRDDIHAAHRRIVALVHPDKGGSNAQVHEVTAARDLLLDELPYES